MQDYLERKWIEMVLIGLWLMFCFVISKSYQGVLTSSLAVRYLPTPFESIQDIIRNQRMNLGFESNAMMHHLIMVQ